MRGWNYTVAQNPSGMSQVNDVARCRHFLYYLRRALPQAANCEPRHGATGADRIPITLGRKASAAGCERTAKAPPGVVMDSAQKDKSLMEAFKLGTELRYIRLSRHRGVGELE